MNRSCPRHRQQGFSLIDVMVGIVIALVAVLVVFQVFAVGEQFKRNTTSIGEAQVNGLLASFMLGLQLANSGNALAVAAQDLAACDDQAAEPDPVKRFAKSWRPIPILIFDSGAAGTPDSFTVNYSTSTTLVAPALVIAKPANNIYVAQSPNGFHPIAGEKREDLIVAIQNAPFGAVGQCAAAKVTAVVPSTTAACMAAQGCVELTFTPAAATTPYSVFNMGSADDVQKVCYDVAMSGVAGPCVDFPPQTPVTCPPTTPCALRGTPLIDKNTGTFAALPPNPIASNIVNMKLQYGIDTNNDELLDTWVSATGQWAPTVLLDKNLPNAVATINQIKAVRIGVIVRSEQFDKNYTQDVVWSMFNGTYSGTYAQSVSPPGNWRYRVYETVIPLRNEIWNKQ